jgi:2-haloacid dehalogenase
MPRVCVFDVNETLLDLQALDPHFQRIFGDPTMRQAWFNQLIQSALVTIVTDAYTDFGTVGGAALDMLAARQGTNLSAGDRQAILSAIKTLPPHPDVTAGLAQLRNAGLRLAVLTNSTEEVAQAQIANAGLTEYFEHILSANSVQRLKPAPEPYRMTAEQMHVSVKDIRLVAAHAWDVAGAMQAGCAAAFIARPGKVLDPLFIAPDIVGNDLSEVAERILATETGAER